MFITFFDISKLLLLPSLDLTVTSSKGNASCVGGIFNFCVLNVFFIDFALVFWPHLKTTNNTFISHNELTKDFTVI